MVHKNSYDTASISVGSYLSSSLGVNQNIHEFSENLYKDISFKLLYLIISSIFVLS